MSAMSVPEPPTPQLPLSDPSPPLSPFLPDLPQSTSPYILNKKILACGKYQGLGTISYIDPRDEQKVPRERDYIFLRGRDPREPVGTLIPNIYRDAQGTWCTVLVRQFRPQYETDTVEFPAGFVSRRLRGETVEQAAVRELEEETTKTGIVMGTSPPLTSEPIPIAARLKSVFVRAQDKDGQEQGTQRLDKGEFAVEVVVPLKELESRLVEFDAEDVLIDPRVWMFAIGIRYALELDL